MSYTPIVHHLPYIKGSSLAVLTTTFGRTDQRNGTNFANGVMLLAKGEKGVANFRIPLYGGGSWTVDIDWYPDTDTTNTHVAVLGARVASITPSAAVDVETKGFGSQVTTTTTITSQTHGPLRTTITITTANLNSAVSDDMAWLEIQYVSASSTVTGDIVLNGVNVSYARTT